MRIRYFADQIKVLYKENDFPSDKLSADPEALAGFCDAINERLGTRFSPMDVVNELQRIRKDKKHTGGLPHLGRSYGGPKFRHNRRAG